MKKTESFSKTTLLWLVLGLILLIIPITLFFSNCAEVECIFGVFSITPLFIIFILCYLLLFFLSHTYKKKSNSWIGFFAVIMSVICGLTYACILAQSLYENTPISSIDLATQHFSVVALFYSYFAWIIVFTYSFGYLLLFFFILFFSIHKIIKNNSLAIFIFLICVFLIFTGFGFYLLNNDDAKISDKVFDFRKEIHKNELEEAKQGEEILKINQKMRLTAIETVNISICHEMAEDSYDTRSSCMLGVITKIGMFESCKDLRNAKTKYREDQCYANIARDSLNAEICNNIRGVNDRIGYDSKDECIEAVEICKKSLCNRSY